MITIENISYSVGNKSLLQNITAQLKAGQIHLVIGPNGAGKSTFLKTVTGQLKPAQGKIKYGGKNLNEFTVTELAKKRALLSQSIDLSFPFKVEEVVLMGRYPFFSSKPSKHDWKIVEECMEMFDVTDFAERNYLTLSGGEKQRVQFARVLAQILGHDDSNERFLILDEPLNALDIYYQYDFMTKLRSMAREKNLIVLGVLHDLNLVAKYADTILLLHHGTLVDIGSNEQVLTVDNIKEVYRVDVEIHKTGEVMHLLF